MIDKNLLYNDILFNKIKRSSYILNVDKNNHYIFDETLLKEKNLKVKNINYENILKEEDKYDFVIFYQLCSEDDNLISMYLDKSKNIIKDSGYIILINILLTSYYYYNYHPFSYIQKCILGKPIYLTILDDMLRDNGFKIKNMSRLYSVDVLKYPIEYFCIIIEN